MKSRVNTESGSQQLQSMRRRRTHKHRESDPSVSGELNQRRARAQEQAYVITRTCGHVSDISTAAMIIHNVETMKSGVGNRSHTMSTCAVFWGWCRITDKQYWCDSRVPATRMILLTLPRNPCPRSTPSQATHQSWL
ncbi:hypothetical protein BV22DRAFT_1036837 [Leucogyrophana mollusca]|uniref:Uncharacterized protein n=1 Tax=Leucogyrophana mollusca TaxID=85980 RepID=A0ACB8BBC1_9AGAM|nr:hypothetical protein BV22DRAFT_1036837 [Leucogyrophana mollusca]